jgi:hypothetical protein
MYTIILVILLGIAALIIFNGVRKRKVSGIVFGVLFGLLTVLFFWFMNFWGEVLWFRSVGQVQRLWTEILAKVGFLVIGALIGWLFVFIFTSFIPKQKKYTRLFARSIGALSGAIMGVSNWDLILRYVNRVSANFAEPILEKDVSFYLFSLPFYDLLYELFLLLSVISLVFALSAIYVQIRKQGAQFKQPDINEQMGKHPFRAIYASGFILILVLAYGKYLAPFHLLYSDWGAVSGPGWTDVHIRLPAYYISIIITIIFAIILLFPFIRRKLSISFTKSDRAMARYPHFILISIGIYLLAVWFIILSVFPGLFQWLRVEPNEITFEKPYIKNNIEYTRHGFRLHNVEEKEFPVSEEFSRQMVNQNQNLLSNIRLWDYRALDAVYKQFQEIRLYYEFVDVDIDRYHIDDTYRQVMVSARELEFSNLPEQSQTFVNKRFKYTHGYGITLTKVSEFTPQGLPNLLVKDIPPKSEYKSLKVDRPEIYYGELTNYYVVVNSREKEFDYPSGEKNIYTRYQGSGGVKISNLWRKFLFGWKFGGTRFFLSGYPTKDSRLMFHRQIKDRVNTIAPFLEYDNDPYVVLADGKLYWIIDAYTTSKYYPYSEPFSTEKNVGYQQDRRMRSLYDELGGKLDKINYIRNSVKVVIDAYNGNVDYYIYDEEDPIIQVWDNIFPELFKNKSEMPQELQEHVRYPADLLLVQGLVYAKYHMTDPVVFYNQEDLWTRATEKYYNRVQPVQPYYIMWKIPGMDNLEYSLILPFTPKNKQVMIGWIAGMCDNENYGRFLAYKFPKEKRILGPQQVETKIDQDSFLSGQLSLWDQRGSNVIRGNVLAIPINETILYVEPIYLQAETAAYPELRLVAIMHGDDLSYAESFDEALEGLVKGEVKKTPLKEGVTRKINTEELIQQANRAFENYIRMLGEKNYSGAGNSLQELEDALQKLSNRLETE